MSKQKMPKDYIARDLKIVADVQTCLSRLAAGGEVTELIHNIYGIAGTGKTYVLQQLFDTFQGAYDVIWLGFDLKDQAEAAVEAHTRRPLCLTQASWPEAITTLGAVPGLRNRLPQQVSFDDKLNLLLEHMGNLLWNHKLDGTYQRPLLLLLDSLDNLPYWKWLQEQVIKPLLELRRTLIVCASRAPLFWHYWEIRESCVTYEIPTFKKEETREFLARYHRAPLADTVHELTDGYPLVLKQFIRLLDEPVEALSVVDESLVGLLKTPETATQKILLQVGIMRRVQLSIMQKLLEHGAPGQSWEEPARRQELIAALKEIKDQGFIKIHHDTSDRFAPELRAALRQVLEPAEYQARCRIIADSYYEIARKQPKTEDTAIIEWLFFSTEQFVGNPDTSRSEWEHELSALLERVEQVYQSTDNAAPNLVRQLYLDGELLHKLAELKLLSKVQEELLPLLQGTPLSVRRNVSRACSQALAILGERFMGMTHDDFISFEAALRILRPAGDVREFDQEMLRDHLIREWPALQHRPTRSLTELIVLMNGDGVLQYDRQRRVYQFHPVIDRLLSVEGGKRFGGESTG